MANSPSPRVQSSSEPDSQISAVVYEMSQQMQNAMENMLKMINEIDQNSAGISEEIEKCKESGFQRKKALEEEKQRCQKAAFAVLDMLGSTD